MESMETKESPLRRRSRTRTHHRLPDDNMVISIQRMIHRDCRAEPEPVPEPEELVSFSALARKTPSIPTHGPRPSTERFSLSPNTTVGALKDMLRYRHQLGREFILLQPQDDTYPRALYDENKSLREYGVKDCCTLRMTSTHKFLLHIYNASAVDHPVIQPPPTINSRHGRFILLYPSIYDTVATLKLLIHENTGYPPSIQLLDPQTTKIHEKDDCTLESLGFTCSGERQQIFLLHTPTNPLPSEGLEEEDDDYW